MRNTEPIIKTREEIKLYLDSANLVANYVCGDGTVCEQFKNFAMADRVLSQKYIGIDTPHRMWWIEYVSNENKFILRYSCFDANYNKITKQQYLELLSNKVTLDFINNMQDVSVEWVSTNRGEWSVVYPLSIGLPTYAITPPFNKILHTYLL